jgi:hypothetical protein
MAGTPIKQMRRAGIQVPNLGDRPPIHPVRARPRVASSVPPESNDELVAIARDVLRDVAENGLNENARVAAARALLDLKESLDPGSLSLDEMRVMLAADPKLREMARNWELTERTRDLERMSNAELIARSREAEEVLAAAIAGESRASG